MAIRWRTWSSPIPTASTSCLAMAMEHSARQRRSRPEAPSTYVTTSDFNRDGKRDLAVVNGSANTVSTVFGQGDGTFMLSAPPYATPVGPGSVSAGDFNGDGKPDLAIPTFFGDTTGNTLAILVNGTNGKFAKKTSYLTDRARSAV